MLRKARHRFEFALPPEAIGADVLALPDQLEEVNQRAVNSAEAAISSNVKPMRLAAAVEFVCEPLRVETVCTKTHQKYDEP